MCDVMLYGICEGVVVLDDCGWLVFVNDEVMWLLGLSDDFVGYDVSEVFDVEVFVVFVSDFDLVIDCVVFVGECLLVVNCMMVWVGDCDVGWVLILCDCIELFDVLRVL